MLVGAIFVCSSDFSDLLLSRLLPCDEQSAVRVNYQLKVFIVRNMLNLAENHNN
jgi:hypothetical protein